MRASKHFAKLAVCGLLLGASLSAYAGVTCSFRSNFSGQIWSANGSDYQDAQAKAHAKCLNEGGRACSFVNCSGETNTVVEQVPATTTTTVVQTPVSTTTTPAAVAVPAPTTTTTTTVIQTPVATTVVQPAAPTVYMQASPEQCPNQFVITRQVLNANGINHVWGYCQ